MLGSWDFDKKREIAVNGGSIKFRLRDVAVEPGSSISLKKNFDPAFTGGFKDKSDALERLAHNRHRVAELQETLYADDRYSLLVIFQGMDAAGKDGAVRHVMSGVNPQGCRVTSFKAPCEEDLDHTYLWRVQKALPPRGTIGIFNRSHYEEVLVVRVAARREGASLLEAVPEGLRGNAGEHEHEMGALVGRSRRQQMVHAPDGV